MERRKLHRRAQKLARELRLSYPVNVEELADRVGRRRGRPIMFAPMPLLIRFGAWAFVWDDPARGATVIGYERDLLPAHQALIQLHELAHIVLDHPGEDINHAYSQFDLGLLGHSAHQLTAELEYRLGDRPPVIEPPPRARTWLDNVRGSREKTSSPVQEPAAERGPYADPLEWEAEVLASILLQWTGHYVDPAAEAGSRTRAASLLGENAPW